MYPFLYIRLLYQRIKEIVSIFIIWYHLVIQSSYQVTLRYNLKVIWYDDCVLQGMLYSDHGAIVCLGNRCLINPSHLRDCLIKDFSLVTLKIRDLYLIRRETWAFRTACTAVADLPIV